MIVAAAALALTACDPGPAVGPPPATLGAPVTEVAQLVADARAGIAAAPSATYTTTVVLGTSTTNASGSLSFDGGTSSFTMLADGQEVRVLGRKTFTHAPSAPGKEWIVADPDSTDPISHAGGAAVPVAVKLPDLGRALVEIERTGRIVSAEPTRLGELPVNHYVLELDAAKAPEEFPEFAEPPVDGKPAKPIVAKLPAELWLDAAGRPARFTIDLSTGFAQLRPATGATDYRDWGTPVDIQPPPADQVVDIGELMKQLGR
ncbi:hypothetical protein ILP97_25915 [Amycolatopsis sp. H6(2020)]|nr:hypothetical protein [Amycolatopsis sp. H6(2020)]